MANVYPSQEYARNEKYMIYEDYRKVALKHLVTCEYMKDNFNNIDDGNEEKKDAVLRNIYYLSGYILEGVINFLIYKNIYGNRRMFRNVKHLSEQAPQNTGISDLVSYRHIDATNYCLTNHKFATNIKLIEYKLNTIQRNEVRQKMKSLSNITEEQLNNNEELNTKFNEKLDLFMVYLDILKNERSIQNRMECKLFKKWSHNQVRYQSSTTNFRPSIIYDKSHIFAFFNFAKEIYRILPLL